MKSRFGQVLLLLAVSSSMLVGCALQPVGPQSEPVAPVDTALAPDPVSAVVTGAAEKLNAGDLEESLAYYADDAVFYAFGLPTVAEVYRGKDQIRALLAENVASHFKMEVEIRTVVGDVVNTRTTSWHDFTRQLGVAPLEATEIYVIEDGKIAIEAWTIAAESLAKLQTALAAAMPPEPEAPAQAAIAPATDAVTITFAGGTCSYEGSLTLKTGRVAATMDVHDLGSQRYALTFFTLETGKGFDDLMAATVLNVPPSWAHMIGIAESGRPGKTSTFHFQVEEGPVYLICWSAPPEMPVGAVGPFAVDR